MECYILVPGSGLTIRTPRLPPPLQLRVRLVLFQPSNDVKETVTFLPSFLPSLFLPSFRRRLPSKQRRQTRHRRLTECVGERGREGGRSMVMTGRGNARLDQGNFVQSLPPWLHGFKPEGGTKNTTFKLYERQTMLAITPRTVERYRQYG